MLGCDTALLAASAILITGLLAVCSKLLLGQFNFITPTVKSAIVSEPLVRATLQPLRELELGSV